MKVALVHDWLTGMRGGEWVLYEIARMFPDAPIYTLIHRPGSSNAELEAHPIRTSWLQMLSHGGRAGGISCPSCRPRWRTSTSAMRTS